MIQRKQTLFLLLVIFLGVSLMFIKNADVIHKDISTHIFLIPIANSDLISSIWHYIAIAINFVNLLLCFAVIFMYKKRHLQIRICTLIIVNWIVLGITMVYCPFVEKDPAIEGIIMNYFTILIVGLAIFGAWMAIRNIRKDIELLKSADRIR